MQENKAPYAKGKTSQKRIKLFAVLLVSVVMVSLVIFQIVRINTLYPGPKLREFSLGEEAIGGDIGITVTGVEIVEGDAILKLIPTYKEMVTNRAGELVGIDQVRIIICDVVVVNHGDEPHTVLLNSYTLQVGMWKNGLDFELMDINSEVATSLQLNPGEKTVVRLPYKMYDIQFKNQSDWESILDERFDLVLLKYPVKVVVHMS